MKPSIFQGQNLAQLSYSHIMTLRFYNAKGISNTRNQIEKLITSLSSINHVSYTIENGKDNNHLHAHLLLILNDVDKFEKELKDLICPNHDIEKGSSQVLVKEKKQTILIKDEVPFKDVYIDCENQTYFGKKLKIFVQKIISKTNAALYTFKSNDYGLNSGSMFRVDSGELIHI